MLVMAQICMSSGTTRCASVPETRGYEEGDLPLSQIAFEQACEKSCVIRAC